MLRVLYTKQNWSICILGLDLLANNFISYPSKFETLQCIHLNQQPPTPISKRQQFIPNRWMMDREMDRWMNVSDTCSYSYCLARLFNWKSLLVL